MGNVDTTIKARRLRRELINDGADPFLIAAEALEAVDRLRRLLVNTSRTVEITSNNPAALSLHCASSPAFKLAISANAWVAKIKVSAFLSAAKCRFGRHIESEIPVVMSFLGVPMPCPAIGFTLYRCRPSTGTGFEGVTTLVSKGVHRWFALDAGSRQFSVAADGMQTGQKAWTINADTEREIKRAESVPE